MPEVRLLCEAGQEPLRSLRLEYPAVLLTEPLNTKGQGCLLLQEKALGQASQWLPACAAGCVWMISDRRLAPESLVLSWVYPQWCMTRVRWAFNCA